MDMKIKPARKQPPHTARRARGIKTPSMVLSPRVHVVTDKQGRVQTFDVSTGKKRWIPIIRVR